VETFVFDRPVPTESSELKSPFKCTCFRRPKSSPVQQQPPPPSINESTTRVNAPNRHSSLMQTATLSHQ
jgi:hypothetical protein